MLYYKVKTWTKMFSQILILGVGLVLVQSSPVPEPSQYHQGRQNEPSSFTARVLPKPEYTDWHNETRQRWDKILIFLTKIWAKRDFIASGMGIGASGYYILG